MSRNKTLNKRVVNSQLKWLLNLPEGYLVAISACVGTDCSLTDTMERMLRAEGHKPLFDYIRVVGKWGGVEEDSFLVFTESESKARTLVEKGIYEFNQEDVYVWKTPMTMVDITEGTNEGTKLDDKYYYFDLDKIALKRENIIMKNKLKENTVGLDFQGIAAAVKDAAGWLGEIQVDNVGETIQILIAERDDKLDPKDVNKILSSGNAWDVFYDLVADVEDNSWDWFHATKEEVIRSVMEEYPELDEDFLLDHLYVNYDAGNLLSQEYSMFFNVDTGDGNYDYTLNPNYSMDEEEIKDLSNEASVVWLAGTQGYSREDVVGAILNGDYKGSKFLESLRQEYIDTLSHMNSIIFLGTMSLKDMMDSKETGSIKVPANTVLGFWDGWSGSGSTIGIELEKPVVVPYEIRDRIYTAYGKTNDVYTPQEIYGFTSKVYNADFILEAGLREKRKTRQIKHLTENKTLTEDANDNTLTLHLRSTIPDRLWTRYHDDIAKIVLKYNGKSTYIPERALYRITGTKELLAAVKKEFAGETMYITVHEALEVRAGKFDSLTEATTGFTLAYPNGDFYIGKPYDLYELMTDFLIDWDNDKTTMTAYEAEGVASIRENYEKVFYAALEGGNYWEGQDFEETFGRFTDYGIANALSINENKRKRLNENGEILGKNFILRDLLNIEFPLNVLTNDLGEYLGYDEEDFTKEELDKLVKVTNIYIDADGYIGAEIEYVNKDLIESKALTEGRLELIREVNPNIIVQQLDIRDIEKAIRSRRSGGEDEMGSGGLWDLAFDETLNHIFWEVGLTDLTNDEHNEYALLAEEVYDILVANEENYVKGRRPILDENKTLTEAEVAFLDEMRYKDYIIEFFKDTQDKQYYWQAAYDGDDRKFSNFNVWIAARGISLYSEDNNAYPTKANVVSKAKEWVDTQKRKWKDSLTEAADIIQELNQMMYEYGYSTTQFQEFLKDVYLNKFTDKKFNEFGIKGRQEVIDYAKSVRAWEFDPLTENTKISKRQVVSILKSAGLRPRDYYIDSDNYIVLYTYKQYDVVRMLEEVFGESSVVFTRDDGVVEIVGFVKD